MKDQDTGHWLKRRAELGKQAGPTMNIGLALWKFAAISLMIATRDPAPTPMSMVRSSWVMAIPGWRRVCNGKGNRFNGELCRVRRTVRTCLTRIVMRYVS